MSSVRPALLPSCTENYFTAPEDGSDLFSGLSVSRTVEGCLPSFGTLPSIDQWRSLDSISNMLRSHNSLYLNHQLATKRFRHVNVNHTRKTKVISRRCSDAVTYSRGSAVWPNSDSLPSHKLSTPFLKLGEKIISTSISDSSGNRNRIIPPCESLSILGDWPYHDSFEDAPCLVYRSIDDCLPYDANRDPKECISDHQTAINPEDAYASSTVIPLKNVLHSMPFTLLHRFSVQLNPTSHCSTFTSLTEPISRFCGELAASVVAGYQNRYRNSSLWARRIEVGCFSRQVEWNNEMRALEMDQWVPYVDAT